MKPLVCLLCGGSIAEQSFKQILLNHDETVLCLTCENQFQLIGSSVCQECGRVLEGKDICVDCQIWQQQKNFVSLHNRALFVYDEMMQRYMHQYKFIGDYRLRTAFRYRWGQLIRSLKRRNQIDWIVPIPVSPVTLATRGFNQVEGILTVAHLKYESVLCTTHQIHQSSKKTYPTIAPRTNLSIIE